ncbi:MAG: hypothetical protein EOP42_06105 [Sphingobacteriaceae bacterium]|nr:MAG: hypothetical protein EOP42_06105 [Sphingobacteriaceae bacterium]
MIVPIKSIHDLRNEIVRLETLTVQQEATIKQRFSSPKIIYKTILSVFPKSAVNEKGDNVKISALLNQDVVATISKFLLPFTLNRTLFKGSGFITKSVVNFLSQKASGYINQDTVVSGWDKFKKSVSSSNVTNTVLAKVKPLENFFSKLKSPAKKSIVLAKPTTTNTPIVIKKLD